MSKLQLHPFARLVFIVALPLWSLYIIKPLFAHLDYREGDFAENLGVGQRKHRRHRRFCCFLRWSGIKRWTDYRQASKIQYLAWMTTTKIGIEWRRVECAWPSDKSGTSNAAVLSTNQSWCISALNKRLAKPQKPTAAYAFFRQHGRYRQLDTW